MQTQTAERQELHHVIDTWPDSRVVAMLDFVKSLQPNNEIVIKSDQEERMSWLKKFHSSVKQSADEELPDFSRARFGRELVNLSDEG